MRTLVLAALVLLGLLGLWVLSTAGAENEALAVRPARVEVARDAIPSEESAVLGEAPPTPPAPPAPSEDPREVASQAAAEDGGWLTIPPGYLVPPGGERRMLVGRVRSSDGQPLGGALLTLEMKAQELAVPVERAYSRADGRYWLPLPDYGPADMLGNWLEQRDRKSGVGAPPRRGRPDEIGKIDLRLRASRSGFLPRDLPLRVSTRRGSDLRLDVLLEEGELVTGRVVDGRGNAVSGASVRLVPTIDLFGGQETRSELDGSWRLKMPAVGIYHLHARREGVGAAVVEELEVPPLADAPLPDVMLRGDAYLEGRVLYPNGEPAAAVRIDALPAEIAQAGAGGVRADRLLLEESRGGLWGSFADSDEQGRFRVEALAPGPYALAFRDSPLSPAVGPIETSASDLGLEYGVPRLRVEVDWSGADTWEPLRLQLERTGIGVDRERIDMSSEHGLEPGSTPLYFPLAGGPIARLLRCRASLWLGAQELSRTTESFTQERWEQRLDLSAGWYLALDALEEPPTRALGSRHLPVGSGLEDAALSLTRPPPLAPLRLLLRWNEESLPGDEIPRLELRLLSLEPAQAILPLMLFPVRIEREHRTRLGNRPAAIFDSAFLEAGRYRVEMRVDGEVSGSWEVEVPGRGRAELELRLPARAMSEDVEPVR